jgi:hypothetical protein
VAALKQVHLEELQAVRCYIAQLHSTVLCCAHYSVMHRTSVAIEYFVTQLVPLLTNQDLLTLPRPHLSLFRGRARDGVALDQLAGQIKQTSGSIKILEVRWDLEAVEERRGEEMKAEQGRAEECNAV